MNSDMALPIGKTCGDCAHFKRCVALFGCKPTNITCDWSPSRFQLSSKASAESRALSVDQETQSGVSL